MREKWEHSKTKITLIENHKVHTQNDSTVLHEITTHQWLSFIIMFLLKLLAHVFGA